MKQKSNIWLLVGPVVACLILFFVVAPLVSFGPGFVWFYIWWIIGGSSAWAILGAYEEERHPPRPLDWLRQVNADANEREQERKQKREIQMLMLKHAVVYGFFCACIWGVRFAIRHPL